MSTHNAVVALIHDHLGTSLKNIFKNSDNFSILDKQVCLNSNELTLLHQLEQVDRAEDAQKPPKATFKLLIDIVGPSVSSFLNGLTNLDPKAPLGPFFPFFSLSTNVLSSLQKLFGDQLKFFEPKRDALVKLVTSRNARDRIKAIGEVFQDTKFFTDGLQRLIGDETGAVLSLATIGSALEGSPLNNAGKVPEGIEEALLNYFFRTEGFQTIDGSSIVSAVHLSDIADPLTSGAAGFNQLKSLFSKATAETYIRDIIRITVEAAYDTARNLRPIYQNMKTGVQKRKSGDKDKQTAIEKKFVNWFKGFSVVAESMAMRTVEVATQGISGFQTNPLIAAGGGTFAGTVARKLAQDAFLERIQADLR